ncbi:sensor histidine kinase [Dyadobacter sp. CY323]|uniref:sensor histidine kinase n=1 Tax=Dyadobacter sp. CY323 TaxID=2907302 RepID=UPI001F458D8B|nr:histidine kinase [Dyadobacter sp. CY323]MCE6991874.1 histidine kinase [Dyadobacter sp. CY323]
MASFTFIYCKKNQPENDMSFLDRQVKFPFSNRPVVLKYALVHAAYWVLITGFFLYEKRYLIRKASLNYFAICVTGRVVLLIVIAYLNMHYFLPRYLLKKQYSNYFSLVLISILVYLIIQSLFDYYLYGYVIGPMRNTDWIETLSYNFFSTMWYLALMLALKLSIDWYEQQRIFQKILVEKLNAEVNFLRSQVNPHFLFNILNNLYALTLKKSDLAPDVVLKLSEMMEYMLYDSDDPKVALGKEISYLHNYIALEKIRYDHDADISLQVNGDPDGKEIAPLLILPLVENAFKHGLSKKAENGWLHGKINVSPSSLEVTVENNKSAGLTVEGKGGIGLENLRKRLELLYPARHLLQIDDSNESFKVFMEIQLQPV